MKTWRRNGVWNFTLDHSLSARFLFGLHVSPHGQENLMTFLVFASHKYPAEIWVIELFITNEGHKNTTEIFITEVGLTDIEQRCVFLKFQHFSAPEPSHLNYCKSSNTRCVLIMSDCRFKCYNISKWSTCDIFCCEAKEAHSLPLSASVVGANFIRRVLVCDIYKSILKRSPSY